MTNAQRKIPALVAGPDCSDNWGATLVSRAREFATLRRAMSNGIRAGLMGSLMAGSLCVSLPVQAMPFMQPLDFVTASDQSLWGTGGASGGFSYSGRTGFSVATISLTVGYSIGASSGTASAKFNGNMAVDYTPTLPSPGMTTLDLSFQGNAGGGQLKTDLGAHAQLFGPLVTVGPDFTLSIDKGYTPQLDQAVSANDSVTVAQIPVLNALVAEAGVSMGVTQTDNFMATAIDGSLYYSRQGSGIMNFIPFTLATIAGSSLNVNLGDVGIWDFWFVDQTLANTFSTALDMDLGLYAQTLGCGFLGLSWCNPYTQNLASVNVYDSGNFPLAFNSITNMDGFSIQVGTTQVPEPTVLALVGIGLAGLRRRNLPS